MNEKCWTGGLLNPVIARIHDFTRVDTLEVRREIQLLNMMFLLKKERDFAKKVNDLLELLIGMYLLQTLCIWMYRLNHPI